MATAIYLTPTPAVRQRWFFVGLLLVLALINIQYFLKLQRTYGHDRSAIQRWLPQLEDLAEGANIWEKHNFPYSPMMSLLLMPLAYLPPLAAAMVWFFVKAVLALLEIHLVFAMLDHPDRPFPTWAKLVALGLSVRPIQGDLVHGNINLFVLFVIVASLHAFLRQADVWAGLGLAFAIACKVTPALFIPYFLWKRAWKTLAATMAGLAVFLFVAPALFWGWQANEAFLGSWYGKMIEPFVVEGEVLYSELSNQSLPGLATRMLTHSRSFSQNDEAGARINAQYHNFIDLDPRLVGWLVKACLGLFGLLVIWSCRTPIDGPRDWRLVAEFAVVLLGMLLFSERTWKHHCVTLLIPFAVLSSVLALRWNDSCLRRRLVSALVLAGMLMCATSTGLFDSHDRLGKLAQVYGAYVWVFLILLAALGSVLARSSTQGVDTR